MACSRRDLLAAFLGIPAALAVGCRGRLPLPPGELVGANVLLGHRLRLGPPPPPSTWKEVPVVIVGAGVAGLSAAWRLARERFDRFVVLELESAPGGTARAGTGGIVPYPWGAHYLPAPMADNRALLSLLREMSVIEGTDPDGQPIYAEQVLCRDPQERLFAYGNWYDGLYLSAGASDEDRHQQRRFFDEVDRWVTWRDGKGRKAFTLPTAAASDDPEVTALDKLSMADWLKRKGLTSKRLQWNVDYGCRDDYGARPEDTSAWAGLFYFASRRKAPGADPQPLLSWPEGNGRLVAHLASRCKKQLQVDLAVADIRPTDPAGKKGVEILALSARDDRVVGFRAEQVIFAAPQFLARFVLRPYRERSPEFLRAFAYGSWMVANLHLKDRPAEPGVPLAWDNVFYDSPSLGYVVATHQACVDYGPTIFTYYYPLTASNVSAARAQLLELGRDEWAELALADLERAHPDIRRLTTQIDVMRWGHAMVRPEPGFVWGPDRRRASAPWRGIHFAHSDLSGLALFEEAFYHGVRAAEEILHARGEQMRTIL
jgi:protoporphyrinogen oxidase